MSTLLFAIDTISIVAMCCKKKKIMNVLVKVVDIESLSPICREHPIVIIFCFSE